MRTIRAADAKKVYAHPGTQVARLERKDLLHRVAFGYYVVVPQDRIGTNWRPPIEAVAAGIATAIVGERIPVLMGLTAARIHHALPRALGEALVAVPKWHRPIRLSDRDGTIRFVERKTDQLDAEVVATELGKCLATTPEQTVLDLAHRPQLGHAEGEAWAAIKALLPRCDHELLVEIATQQRLRASLVRVERIGTSR
ncbi:MAG: type IV toxin-antitoxin system AbiEi family antitoxin [Actinomycetota bacterium]